MASEQAKRCGRNFEPADCHYTPSGYKEALAELEALRAQVARLTHSLDGIKEAMWSELHTIDECPQWRYPDFSKAILDFRRIAHNFLCASVGDAKSSREWLEQKIAEAVQAERERCAKVAEAIGEPQPIQRSTIAELEKILADQEDRKVYVMPDGQVTTEIPLALQIAAAIREGR